LPGKPGVWITPDAGIAPPQTTGVGVGAGDEEGIGMDEEAGVGEGVGVGIAVGVGRGRDPTLHPLVLQHCVTQDWILLPLLSLREAHAKSQNISGKHPLVKMTSLVLESNASWVKQTLSTGHSIISCIAVHIVSLEPWQLEQFSCIGCSWCFKKLVSSSSSFIK